MKKIQSRLKALEWSQLNTLIFQTLKGSQLSDGIVLTFKLIRAFMVGLVTCKNEEDPSKNEGTSGHNISPIISLWGFHCNRPEAFYQILTCLI